MNEIATAVRHQIPIIEVVINNHVLGMVRQWQNLFYEQRYSATVLIDCIIDSDDKVWPMVAPGAAISEAFDEEDMKEE